VMRRYSPGFLHLWGFLPSGPGISFKLPPLLRFPRFREAQKRRRSTVFLPEDRLDLGKAFQPL
jgi:hypothetical protein